MFQHEKGKFLRLILSIKLKGKGEAWKEGKEMVFYLMLTTELNLPAGAVTLLMKFSSVVV